MNRGIDSILVEHFMQFQRCFALKSHITQVAFIFLENFFYHVTTIFLYPQHWLTTKWGIESFIKSMEYRYLDDSCTACDTFRHRFLLLRSFASCFLFSWFRDNRNLEAKDSLTDSGCLHDGAQAMDMVAAARWSTIISSLHWSLVCSLRPSSTVYQRCGRSREMACGRRDGRW